MRFRGFVKLFDLRFGRYEDESLMRRRRDVFRTLLIQVQATFRSSLGWWNHLPIMTVDHLRSSDMVSVGSKPSIYNRRSTRVYERSLLRVSYGVVEGEMNSH